MSDEITWQSLHESAQARSDLRQAEIARLRAEVEALTAELRKATGEAGQHMIERDRLRDALDRADTVISMRTFVPNGNPFRAVEDNAAWGEYLRARAALAKVTG